MQETASARRYELFDREAERVMITNLGYEQAVQLREQLVSKGHHEIEVREMTRAA